MRVARPLWENPRPGSEAATFGNHRALLQIKSPTFDPASGERERASSPELSPSERLS